MKHAPLLLSLVALFASAAAAEPLAVGSTLAPLTLLDQHEVAGSVDASTKLVLYARDMDGAGLVEESLATDGAAKLQAAGAVVVAEISGMPSLIASWFAIPKLQKRPYRMLLDREGEATAHLPAEKGKVTLLRLDALKVVAVEFAASTDAVSAALAPAAE